MGYPCSKPEDDFDNKKEKEMWYGAYPWMPNMMAWGWPMGGPYFMPPGYGTGYSSPYPGGFGAPGMPPFGPPMSPDQELDLLKNQAEMLRQQLDQIDARVKELENITR